MIYEKLYISPVSENEDVENEEIDEIDETEEFKDDWGAEDEETE